MEAFIGEIRAFSFERAPDGWLRCEGQELPKSQFQALYSVIEDSFGQTSQSGTFRLPDLRGTVSVGAGELRDSGMQWGDIYKIGSTGGVAEVMLVPANIPQHNHTFYEAVAGNYAAKATRLPSSNSLISNLLENGPGGSKVATGNTIKVIPNTKLAETAVSFTGGDRQHENMQPYLIINYCICVDDGEYPVKAS